MRASARLETSNQIIVEATDDQAGHTATPLSGQPQ
jgi:hypothetical protein